MTRILSVQKAFTLVELALVIGIIGQLAAFAITESMSMMGDVEEAMLDNYYQQLQNGYGKYVAEMGKRPKRFEDFVAPTKELLDPSNGKAMTILFDKDNKPACWYNVSSKHAGDNTLTCIAGNVTTSAVRRRAAIFLFKTGTGMMLQKKMVYDLTI